MKENFDLKKFLVENKLTELSKRKEATHLDSDGKEWEEDYTVIEITPENQIVVDWENTDTMGYSFEGVYSKLGLDPSTMKIFSGGFAAINKDPESDNLVVLARYGDVGVDPVEFNDNPVNYSPETRRKLLRVVRDYRKDV